MIHVLISFKKNIVKVLLFIILLFPVMLFLNTGFLIETPWKIIQALIFTVVFTAVLIWPGLKKIIFYLGLVLITLTAILYIVSLMEWADIIGSTGFGFVIINLLAYLPQMIKLGYIKRL